MSDPDIQNKSIHADFGEQGGRVSWKTIEEALLWIAQIRNGLEWIGQLSQNPTNFAWNTIYKHLDQAITALNQAKQSLAENQPDATQARIQSACSTLEDFFRRYPWLLENSARRVLVKEVKDSGNALEAGIIIAYWMQLELSGPPMSVVISATLRAELFDRGIKDRARGEGVALKALTGSLQSQLTSYQTAESSQATRFDSLFDSLTNQSTTQQDQFTQAQVSRSDDWSALINETKAELTKLQETYDKHMALAAPVEYWESKRKLHRNWSLGAFVIVVSSMTLGGYLLHTELQNVGQAILEASAATKAASPSGMSSFAQSAATWHLGSFILMATLAFWLIRLIVRIFLSHLHLENDAAERVTMAKTYLAFIRDGQFPKEDSINTILAALFRPTGDGIVKDEGVPPTTLEWFTKLGR